MPAFSRIVIVGVGLIGGSIGKAARSRGIAQEVVGLTRSDKSAERAAAAGVVDRVTTNPAEAATDADLVVICTPVGSIVPSLESLLPHLPSKAIVTDAGSTKANIVRQVEEVLAAKPSDVRFVGSHPLTGDTRTGPEAACGDLFDGKTVVLTNTSTTDADAFSRTTEFWKSLGANVEFMAPDEHDAAVAQTSHLPHLIASLLAASTPEDMVMLTAGGWRDTTRVASGDPDLWVEIFRDNRNEVAQAARRLGDQLGDIVECLAKEDWSKVRALLEAGKQRRDAVDTLSASVTDQDD